MNDLDKNKRFPIQNAEARPNECVGIAIADVLGNYHQTLLDSDFSEAVGFHIQGKGGSDGGIDLLAAMYGACLYGALPENLDTSDPLQTSEAIETDWKSYTPQQIATAAKLAPPGIKQLYSFDQVLEHLLRGETGCVLQLTWDTSWTGREGQVTIPTGASVFSQHAVAVYGYSALGLQIKAWDVPAYHYLPRSIFDKVFVKAVAFDMTALRWWTYVQAILETYNWNLLPLLNNGIIKKP